MKQILKQKSNGLLDVFCRTGGITCSSVVDIIWYFLQLDFYLFMLIYTTRFRKLPCLKRIYCLTYFHFLIDVPQRKSDFSKITHIFLGVLSIYWNILTLKILASQFLEYLRLGNAFSSDLGLSNLKISPSVQTMVAPCGGTKLTFLCYLIKEKEGWYFKMLRFFQIVAENI